MAILRQSTARTILIGPILDAEGAAKTDEVVGNIRLAKNGTVAAANASATLTHNHAGKYLLALTASDADTVGVLEISLNSGTNDMQVQRVNVVEEAVFDSIFALGAVGYQVPIWANAASTVDLSGTTVGLTSAAIASIWAALTSGLSTVGSIGKFLVDALTGVGLGSGARTVTPTVQTSGAVAIEGARIRFTKGAESKVGTTDVNGQVSSFNLDDGTWTVSITATGYTFAGTTLVVDGTETPTYTMTSNQPSAPANPLLSTGSILCLDTSGAVQEGVIIYTRMTTAPSTDGYGYTGRTFTMTSGADGVASHAGYVRGAGYRSKRGKDGKECDEYTVPDAGNFSLPEILGQP